MILDSINITNFKNIRQASLDFSPKINCIVGNNGMGKSNLLDAIYMLSFAKSYTGVPDNSLITDGEQFSMIRGSYLRRDTPETLSLSLGGGHRKTLRRGDKAYQRISQHIGAFPLVLSSPADMELAGGAPECRRRFIDQVISQSDPVYLDALLRYNHALEQRNSMLRNEVTDPVLYQAVELPMCMAAATLVRCRAGFIERLSEIFTRYHADIAGEAGEEVTIAYSSAMADGTPLEELLERNRRRDEILHHTSAGPHRDELELTLNRLPLRRTASQGQAKSYTIALRLAQYDFLREAAGVSPLLLLDDLFDKLDAGRVSRIVDIVSRDDFGQIFITDTKLAADPLPEGTASWHAACGAFIRKQ
ncbi:MAG: DNA replication and repair protein RecF [Muribaculaceae bacterium]|nr:DNA replication and repair protein RecF [Muribaculaceae bacterium]MDE5929294.1 DNA replication and repair protein RecF [Muribaculaceae bacterium]MDE6130727.1 DNA replication and repair protein RecF [Muribaculaceae bacterium]